MMASSRTFVKPMDGGNIKTVDAALYLVDDVVSNLSNNNLQNGMVIINLMSLANYLTNHGIAVEAMCRDQLDRAFIRFRKSSLDTKIDLTIRKLMLYLIEMRANNWVTTDSVNKYYKSEELPTMPDNAGNSPGAVPPMTSPPLPILTPGETIKSSGKYISPTKIPGKNYFKDEVVIRNSDSGKVMGIKGRRVHMIEELSETVISFQRVNPGAKERLVQVTGPDEAHINYAQQLMGDTIRRNASPVPFRSEQTDLERVGGSSSSVNSSASDESTRIAGYPRAKLHHSLSSNDATLDAYKYTVKVGGNSVKITGSDYSLVMKSKLALDKFFESEPEQVETNEFFTSFDDEVCSPMPSALSEPHLEFTTKPELSHVERPVSAFAAFRDVIPPVVESAGRKYSRFALCMMAAAEICKEPPTDWELLCPATLRKPCQPFIPQSKFEPTKATQISSEEVGKATAVASDNDADTSVVYPSPFSIAGSDAQPGSRKPFVMNAASVEFKPRSHTSPTSPTPSIESPPLTPVTMLPPTNPPRGPEPVEGVIRTTIPFRPKLTNPKLNYLQNNHA